MWASWSWIRWNEHLRSEDGSNKLTVYPYEFRWTWDDRTEMPSKLEYGRLWQKPSGTTVRENILFSIHIVLLVARRKKDRFHFSGRFLWATMGCAQNFTTMHLPMFLRPLKNQIHVTNRSTTEIWNNCRPTKLFAWDIMKMYRTKKAWMEWICMRWLAVTHHSIDSVWQAVISLTHSQDISEIQDFMTYLFIAIENLETI